VVAEILLLCTRDSESLDWAYGLRRGRRFCCTMAIAMNSFWPQAVVLAEDITEALHKAFAAERSAYAMKRAADPMGSGRTTPAQIKKFKDATAAHDMTKAEVARLRAKLSK
jgi:hypothetical protein